MNEQLLEQRVKNLELLAKELTKSARISFEQTEITIRTLHSLEETIKAQGEQIKLLQKSCETQAQ